LPDELEPDYAQRLLERNNAEDTAVEVLWHLSGEQYGACTTIVRPCPPSAPQYRGVHPYDQTVAPFMPSFDAGRWTNYPCGCFGSCNLTSPRMVHLPGPVAEIVTVTIGDVVLDESEYVQEGDVLYRRDGQWPSQDLGKPAGDDGTWSVEYLKGFSPPAHVARLVGQLALEFMAACSGNKCRLPKTVVSTSRNGISHVFDPSRMLSLGYTGLSEVDSWIAAVNPNRLMRGPRVL
jgi:hypothetical protein